MTDLVVRPFAESDGERWDLHVAESWNGTFLHTRKFLSYHGDRFQDASLLIWSGSDELLGVLPAAVDPNNETWIVSHPGISYGGIVHSGAIRGETMIRALQSISSFYRRLGYERLRYKPVPFIFHRYPTNDDLYALFRLAAGRYRCDLASVIDLGGRLPLSENRARNLRKAAKSGLTIMNGTQYMPGFWDILADLLARKHDTEPVHSLAEILDLAERFPDNIECSVAIHEGEIVAGIVTFSTPRALHMQYSAANVHGQKIAASTLVLEESVSSALDRGYRYFSFGICTEHEGRTLNEGLYQFKNGFGAGSAVHEFYELTVGER